MIKRDPETGTTYICIGRIRFIFRNGKYIGWYNAKLNRVI